MLLAFTKLPVEGTTSTTSVPYGSGSQLLTTPTMVRVRLRESRKTPGSTSGPRHCTPLPSVRPRLPNRVRQQPPRPLGSSGRSRFRFPSRSRPSTRGAGTPCRLLPRTQSARWPFPTCPPGDSTSYSRTLRPVSFDDSGPVSRATTRTTEVTPLIPKLRFDWSRTLRSWS